MAETTLPKLLVSREEARQKIQAQIEKGEQLHNQQIDSYDDLNEAQLESNNWSRYNTDLLIRLFDKPVLAKYISINYGPVDYDEVSLKCHR